MDKLKSKLLHYTQWCDKNFSSLTLGRRWSRQKNNNVKLIVPVFNMVGIKTE